MANRYSTFFGLIFLTLLLVGGCDTFEEDIIPAGEVLFAPAQEARPIAPGSSLMIDLKGAIQASQPVSFAVGFQPQNGEVKLYGNGMLEYIPHESFTTGEDFFGINLMSVDSMVLDSDTLYVKMYEHFDELPCFSGALGDYYEIPENGSLSFSPIFNDGYCPQEVKDIFIEMGDPGKGDIGQLDDITYLYTAEEGFVGKVDFLYTVTFVDKEDNTHTSVARIVIEVTEREYEQYPECLDLLQEDYLDIELPRSNVYNIYLPFLDIDCEDGIQVDILDVAYGEAFIDDSLSMVQYSHGTDSLIEKDEILLSLTWGTEDTLLFEIGLFFIDDISRDCEDLTFPQLEPLVIQGEPEEYYEFEVINGDPLCLWLPHHIEVEFVSAGDAIIEEGGYIKWFPSDELIAHQLVHIEYAIVFEDGSRIPRHIEIAFEEFEGCTSKAYPQLGAAYLEEPHDEYRFRIFNNEHRCENLPAEVDINFVSEGEAFVEDNEFIVWQPTFSSFDSAGYVIEYTVTFSDGEMLSRYLEIKYWDGHIDPVWCAEESFLNLYFEKEYLENRYIFEIFNEGLNCNPSVFDIMIQHVSFGEADIIEGGRAVVWEGNGDYPEEPLQIVYAVILPNGIEIIRHIEISHEQNHSIDPDCLEASFLEKRYELDSTVSSFVFDIYSPAPSCSIDFWEVEILEVTEGSAEVVQNGTTISWEAGPLGASETYILYKVNFGDDMVIYRELELFTYEHDEPDDDCLDLNDDEYYYDTQVDSLDISLPDPLGFEMKPLDNDFICTEDYDFDIVAQPEIGEVDVIDNRILHYRVFEEFAGERDVEIKYVVCTADGCDEATIYLTVKQ